MSLFLTDFDQWAEEYEAASPKQKYELMKAAIAEPISLDYAHDIYIGDFLLDVPEILLACNQIDEYLSFWQTFQKQQPALYQEEFPYLDDIPIKYSLFRDRLDEVRHALSQFQANPAKGIDSLAEVLEIVGFYPSAVPSFVELCRAVYHPLAESPELLGGSEVPFGNSIVFDLLERAHEQRQQGAAVDWQAFKREAIQYGVEGKAELWQEIERDLTAELEVGDSLVEWFQRDRNDALRHLTVQFCRELKDRYDLSFITSHKIVTNIWDCLENPEFSATEQADPDEYFATNNIKLDRSVGKEIYTLLSMYPSRGFAILWGIPLLYEFLQEKQVISAEVAEGAISVAQDLQPKLIDAFKQSLWQFDFVHRWPCPMSVSAEAFAAEAEQFAASFGTPTPLSDEPPKESHDDRPFLPAIDPMLMSNAYSLSGQPEKPRKSPLQEARDLGKPKKKSGKKNKKKGFG